jgi:hypothetical protein
MAAAKANNSPKANGLGGFEDSAGVIKKIITNGKNNTIHLVKPVKKNCINSGELATPMATIPLTANARAM